MEFLIVLLLIILNGIFAMSEIAILSVRKHKLQKDVQEGNENALKALELANNPNKFLSTTQVGITMVGIFAGVFGGATIAAHFSTQLHKISFLTPYADILAFGTVVFSITYLSLIFGELVPKRIALNNPEKIAKLISRPMDILSKITMPIVTLLSLSTETILRLLRVKPPDEIRVSEEEVRMLIKEGTEVGVFEVAEKNIVERTFRLSDRKVNSLMTPRKQIVWLEINSEEQKIRDTISKHTHSYYPVCKKSLDHVIGIVRTESLLTDHLVDEKLILEKSLHKPLFVPFNTPALKVLELFKKSGIHLALIIDEYGMIEGLLSITDILEAIVGDIPLATDLEEKEIVRRDKKTWLVDGLLALDDFKEHFHIKKLPDEKVGNFHTVGGFIMHRLGHIPKTGDKFTYETYDYEVVDMDGNRVDKILLTKNNK